MNIQNNKLTETGQSLNQKVQEQETVKTGKPQLKLSEVSNELKSLIAGKIFQGEITEIRDSIVFIRMENGQSLTARLAEPVELYVNQTLSFQVKSSQGGQIEIRPLLHEFLQLPTLTKALDAANLGSNDKNLTMVKALMDEGLPIDKQSILNTNKLMLRFPEADIKNIVQMMKLGIPITKDHLVQFENYKNGEYQIVNEIIKSAEEMPNILAHFMENGMIEEGIIFHKEILDIFFNPEHEGGSSGEGRDTFMPEISGKGQLRQGVEGLEDSLPPIVHSEDKEEGVQNDSLKAQIPGTVSNVGETETLTTGRENFLVKLESLGLPKEIVDGVRSGRVSEKELLQQIKVFLDTGNIEKEDKKALLSNKEYQLILKEGIRSEWLLQPREVTKDKVENLYKKMLGQNNELLQVLSRMNQNTSTLGEHSTNLKNNVDFMNQLNQMLTYLQIPLKLKEQTVHSELFVYTNKKALKKDGENLSVLLHLDMEYLGSTDVYLNLKGKNINIKFQLENKESVRMIKDNTDWLYSRLEEIGYACIISVEGKDAEEAARNEFFGMADRESNIRRYTFDVRT